MEVASELTHRVLAYIATVNREGVDLAPWQVDAFARRPDPKHLSADGSLMYSALALYQAAIGAQREEYTDFLERLGWISVKDDLNCELTPVGHAVLRGLNAPRVDEEALEIVFRPDDRFAYARALGEIAGLRDALIVEPYARRAQLEDMLQLGSVKRLLIGMQLDERSMLGLRAALREESTIEVRQAEQLHDRMFIPTDGPVRTLGVSLNGLGKHTSVMTSIVGPAAQRLRELYETTWSAAKPVPPLQSEPGSQESHTED